MDKLLRLPAGVHDGLEVAILLDREARYGLSTRGDAVDDTLGPTRLDPDDDHGRDIGIGAGADQYAEVQINCHAELQPAIGVRQGERTLDVIRNGLAGRVGYVVYGQDDDVIAHTDASIVAPIALEGKIGILGSHCAVLSVLPSAWS